MDLPFDPLSDADAYQLLIIKPFGRSVLDWLSDVSTVLVLVVTHDSLSIFGHSMALVQDLPPRRHRSAYVTHRVHWVRNGLVKESAAAVTVNQDDVFARRSFIKFPSDRP